MRLCHVHPTYFFEVSHFWRKHQLTNFDNYSDQSTENCLSEQLVWNLWVASSITGLDICSYSRNRAMGFGRCETNTIVIKSPLIFFCYHCFMCFEDDTCFPNPVKIFLNFERGKYQRSANNESETNKHLYH